jgi:RNA-directed DNA polymerase
MVPVGVLICHYLIDALNPMIRGWTNYHRHVVSERTFEPADHIIFSSLWQWAR